ncbi:MAG: MoxR family ATPase [Actinobacteria bacterium]|nr:MoxR family ATPase [Actinomycetota bacterium]
MVDLGLSSIDATADLLRRGDYLASEDIATTVYVAGRLGRPVLVEGPAGTGKTALALALASAAGVRLIRLQCYEGLDESKVLYEWNYRKQLLWLQGGRVEQDGERRPDDLDDIFSEPFLLSRPLLDAVRAGEPTVLLIDEVDRIEMETEALLLEVLSDFQVSIPELGSVAATLRPFTVLTSNATRELSEALRRRCLYLWLDYPSAARERDIVLSKVPGISETLADQVVRSVRTIRDLALRKAPSIAETLDWAATLVDLGLEDADAEALERTLGMLLKHRADIDRVRAELLDRDGSA